MTEPSSISTIAGHAFVAMSFDAEHDAIYGEGIEPALRDAGYEPVCLKYVFTNEDITDRILAEIRKAQIVVADFTAQKRGVYFEAGFALALRKEVYWTCANSDVEQLHFDTNHYQHVDWETPADLRSRLTQKIQAISGQGPYKAPSS